MRSCIVLLSIFIMAIPAAVRAEKVEGKYTQVSGEFCSADRCIQVDALDTEHRLSGSRSHDVTSLVWESPGPPGFTNLLSSSHLSELFVQVEQPRRQPAVGVVATWTNGIHSLSCYSPNTGEEAASDCRNRSERFIRHAFLPGGGVSTTRGRVSVEGCVFTVACDLCDGNNYCDGRMPIGYGTARIEKVVKYKTVLQGRQPSGPFQSLQPPFRTDVLPRNPLPIP